jgi:hypothetical protein
MLFQGGKQFVVDYKTTFFNILLSIVSIFVLYVIIETLVYPSFLPLIPLKFHEYIGSIDTLAQSSKKHLSPKNYIALVGDSYAAGAGTWLLEADPNGNGPFHSAHVIQKMTGRDVITFGKPGAGSIDGVFLAPIKKFSRINSTLLYHLERPKILIVYFYEGNDLNNNLKTIRKYVMQDIRYEQLEKSHALEKFIENYYDIAEGSRRPLWKNAFSLLFMWKLSNDVFFERTEKAQQSYDNFRSKIESVETTNKARISGTSVPIPDELQSPALELDNEEILVGVKAFELALAGLHRFFPNARLIVTDIPAPLSAYELASDRVVIETYEEKNSSRVYPAALVEQKSNQICKLVAAASLRVGAEFVDSRDAIRSLARKHLVHGPKEWKHFNKRGYTELGKILSAHVSHGPERSAGCVSLR